MATLVIEHGPHSGIQRLAEVLIELGHRLQFVQIYKGDVLPPDLDDVDAMIIMGGPQSATDDSLEWLEHEMHLIRQAHDAALPIFGICLGSQLMARALGGEVGSIEGGVRCGWHAVHLTEPGKVDAIHVGQPWTSIQFHWNRDEVKQLPDGATLLATSEQCNVQAWCAGLRTYGIQYHPEIFAPAVDQWIADDPDALTESGQTAESIRAETESKFRGMRRLGDRMFNSVAMYLMPADQRASGVAKDMHH